MQEACSWKPQSELCEVWEHSIPKTELQVWGAGDLRSEPSAPAPISWERNMFLGPHWELAFPCGRGSAIFLWCSWRLRQPLTLSVVSQGREVLQRPGSQWWPRRAGGPGRPSGISEGTNLWLQHFWHLLIFFGLFIAIHCFWGMMTSEFLAAFSYTPKPISRKWVLLLLV